MNNFIVGIIIEIVFGIILIFLWNETYRRTLWLSDSFEWPWHSVSDKLCVQVYGQLILPNEVEVLKDLFKIEAEQISSKISLSQIKIIKRKIIYLNLEKNNLRFLPKSIKRLTSLKKLDLRGNFLISLPKSIGNLTSLKYLNLNGNNLRDLPESIGNLTSLKELNLSDNYLMTIPKSIEKLEKLGVTIIK